MLLAAVGNAMGDVLNVSDMAVVRAYGLPVFERTGEPREEGRMIDSETSFFISVVTDVERCLGLRIYWE